jgi:hypothetical protein
MHHFAQLLDGGGGGVQGGVVRSQTVEHFADVEDCLDRLVVE